MRQTRSQSASRHGNSRLGPTDSKFAEFVDTLCGRRRAVSPARGTCITVSDKGEAVALNQTVAYKSMMLSGVPNFAFAVGYTNSSWTLKVDLVCEHLCRMLAHMDAEGHDTVTPILDEREIELRPLLDFQAGYVQRTVDSFPRQGSHGPWKVQMSYKADRRRLRNGPVEDPALCFQTSPSAHRPQPVAA